MSSSYQEEIFPRITDAPLVYTMPPVNGGAPYKRMVRMRVTNTSQGSQVNSFMEKHTKECKPIRLS